MSIEPDTTTRINDEELPAGATRDGRLDELLADLDSLEGVTAADVDAAACVAHSCTRDGPRLWRIDVDGGRRRTLCPVHAVEFVRRETGRQLGQAFL